MHLLAQPAQMASYVSQVPTPLSQLMASWVVSVNKATIVKQEWSTLVLIILIKTLRGKHPASLVHLDITVPLIISILIQ